MRYVIQCEDCKRPAKVDEQNSKPGNKVYLKVCDVCGGKVKPMID